MRREIVGQIINFWIKKLGILILKYDIDEWKEGRDKIKGNIDCDYRYNTDLGMNVILEKILHYIEPDFVLIIMSYYYNSFLFKGIHFRVRVDEFE